MTRNWGLFCVETGVCMCDFYLIVDSVIITWYFTSGFFTFAGEEGVAAKQKLLC